MNTEEILTTLTDYDTPTICNALELIDNKYRLYGYSGSGMILRSDISHPVAGVAITAKISSILPPSSDQKKLRNDLYKITAECNLPSIICMQDTDPVHIGAFWGEMQASIFRSLGSRGTITEGGVRDIDCCQKLDFCFFSTEILVSHANVHVEAVQCPVQIRGQEIIPGEIVHADKHGFTIIPYDKIGVILAACRFLTEAEKEVIYPSLKSIHNKLQPSIEDIIKRNAVLEQKKKDFSASLK